MQSEGWHRQPAVGDLWLRPPQPIQFAPVASLIACLNGLTISMDLSRAAMRNRQMDSALALASGLQRCCVSAKSGIFNMEHQMRRVFFLAMSFAVAILGACGGNNADSPWNQGEGDAAVQADGGGVDAAGHADSGSADGGAHADSGGADAAAKDQQTSDANVQESALPEASADALPCISPADIIITDARSHLGQPYVYGKTGPCDVGYDCSGLVYAVFKETGYFSIIGNGSARNVPQIAAVFANKGEEDKDLSKLPEPGDLITFGDYAHIGIYVGQKNQAGTFNAKGWIVNALNETAGVVENKVDALIPGVHSYLHTGLSSQACVETDFTPPACP